MSLDEAVSVCVHWSRAPSRLSHAEALARADREARPCGDRAPDLSGSTSRIAVVPPQEAGRFSFDEKVWFERNERVAVNVFSNRVILSVTACAPVEGAGRVGRERLSMRRGLAGWLGRRDEQPALRGGKFRWRCATSCPASQRTTQRTTPMANQTANQRVEETFSSAITNCFRADTLTAQLIEQATRSPEQERRRYQ